MFKQKILILTFSLLTIISLFGQVFASFTTVDVVNEFQNGIVDIEIHETQSNQTTTILPFDEVCYDTRIYNNGADCYIRAEIVFPNEYIRDNSNVFGMNDNWKKNIDGYYYYTKVLKSGETVDLLKGIKFGSIDKEYQNSNFDLNVKVDAIQSENFTANFTTENPWGNVQVLKVNETNPDIKEYEPTEDDFKAIYYDDVKGLVKNFNSFFTNVPELMPGDTYEDILIFENNETGAKEIYFKAQNILNKEFLDNVDFCITDESGNVLYDGKLSDNAELMLGTVKGNSSLLIKFNITVSENVDNEFVLEDSAVKWSFSTKYITADSPNTGDNSNPNFFIAMMFISVVGLFFSIKGGTKHREKDL